MTQASHRLSLQAARDVNWTSARLECLREAIVVLESAVGNQGYDEIRGSLKRELARLRDGLAERERQLRPF